MHSWAKNCDLIAREFYSQKTGSWRRWQASADTLLLLPKPSLPLLSANCQQQQQQQQQQLTSKKVTFMEYTICIKGELYPKNDVF